MTLLASYDWQAFFFMLFALVACAFALGVLFSSNIVRMAFYLTLSLGATSGLFFLAGAEFVGAMQLMIYVGGTLVLLIFGVMLTAHQRFISMRTSAGEWIMALIVGGGLLLLLLQAALSVRGWQEPHPYPGLLSAVKQVEATAKRAGEIYETAERGASSEQGLSAGEVARLAVATDLAESELNAIAESHGDTIAGLAERLESAKGAAEKVRGRLESVAKAPSAGRQSAAALVKQDAAQLARAVTDVGTLVTAAADEVAIRLEDSKSAAPLGLALAGVRIDKQDADPALQAGMSGYLLPFVIVSIHLLAVLIGAAYMARTKRRADRPTSQ